MAKNTFFNELELQQFEEKLKVFQTNPVRVTIDPKLSGSLISRDLGELLKRKLAKIPGWLESRPILLGSWAQEGISFASDLDVLFLGPEVEVRSIMQNLQQQGVKIRSRVPENTEDLTQGVEYFDLISLTQARAIAPETDFLLESGRKKILTSRPLVKGILRNIREDRKKRAKTYDSLTNFLEPNIKHGPGGLRDLEQALWIRTNLDKNIFDENYDIQVLRTYREFFLLIRHHLHLRGFADTLVGSEQAEIGHCLGYADTKEFMREVQRAISRVSFYSDFVLDKALRGKSKELDLEIKTKYQCFNLLKEHADIQSQFKVRRALDVIFGQPRLLDEQLVRRMFDPDFSDESLLAVFRSRLIDKIFPRISRLVGYVQLDHYHRLTADNHILQALRETKRCYKSPKNLLALKKALKITEFDYQVLCWAALYHDIAKGLHGDHSSLGEQLVREDFKDCGIAADITEEVTWIVQEHLSLSQAAFRRNTEDEQTILDLLEKGLNKDRLRRLCFFTAIDILATNPEAWTEWKSKLMLNLFNRLMQSSVSELSKFIKNKKWSHLATHLDSNIFYSLKANELRKDLDSLDLKNKQIQVRVYSKPSQRHLVRFFCSEDHPGLLLELVARFYKSGLSISQAFVSTIPGFGIYDVFEFKSNRPKKSLEAALSAEVNLHEIDWEALNQLQTIKEIECLENKFGQTVLFRGLDKKGFLLAAVKKLADLGVNVRSAKVVSWGGEVEDVFTIESHPHFAEIQRSLLGRPPA